MNGTGVRFMEAHKAPTDSDGKEVRKVQPSTKYWSQIQFYEA